MEKTIMKKILAMLICFAFIATIATTASAQSGSFTDPVGDVRYIYSGADGMPVGYNVDQNFCSFQPFLIVS
jgi:hypothetical protein